MALFGIDISAYEPNVNWQEAKNNISFCFMKASQGNWLDSSFVRLWKESKGIVPRGAYHFYDGRISPILQAGTFVSTMGGDFGELPLVIDIEGEYAYSPNYIFSGWKNWILCIEEIEKLVPNKTVMVYTNVGTWNYHCPPSDSPQLNWLTSHPLWVADYREGSAPRIPTGWNSWLFHQYSESAILPYVNDYYYDDNGRVIPGSVRKTSTDVNWFNGTIEDFKNLLVSGELPQPNNGSETTPQISGKVIVEALNVRAEPSTLSDKVGLLSYGSVISGNKVSGTSPDNYVWMKITYPETHAGKYCAIGDSMMAYYSTDVYQPGTKTEIHIKTHDGIEFIQRRINNSWWYIHIVDLKRVTLKVIGAFDFVDTCGKTHGASLVHNCGGWGLHPDGTAYPNEVAVYSGVVVQNDPIDERPYIGFKDDNAVEFGFGAKPNLSGIKHAFGFDRFIGRDGVYNSAITDRAKEPRTAAGVLDDGRYILIQVDGRSVNSVGATFEELWMVAKEYGIVTLGNADGGGSTAGYNDVLGLFNVPSERRAVVNRALFFSERLDPPVLIEGELPGEELPGEEPPGGDVTMDYDCVVIKATRVRTTPTVWGAEGKINGSTSLPVGYKFQTSNVVIREKVGQPKPEEEGIWVLVQGTQENGWWTAATYKGEDFINMTPIDEPTTPPPSSGEHLILDIQFYRDSETGQERLVVNGEEVPYTPL